MKIEFNHLIEHIIQSHESTLLENKLIVDQLVTHLCNITNVELPSPDTLDTEATRTSTGEAVSMKSAANCAKEFMRTQLFLRGINQAIKHQLNQQGCIKILYAGTGPFGLLVLPLLHRYSDTEIQVTLLDIHQESLNALQHVIDALGLSNYIQHLQRTDILQWPVPKHEFDIIVSETMMFMLTNEPQVSIFRHIVPALKPSGCLIPQQVVLDAWLQPNEPDVTKDQNTLISIGNLYTLCKKNALALNRQDSPEITVNLPLPNYHTDTADLRFTTRIQTYGDHWLTDNQCSLNLPLNISNANPQPNSTLTAQYMFNNMPGFSLNFLRKSKKVDRMSDTSLPSFDDCSVLGLPYFNRLWHGIQLKKQNAPLVQNVIEKEWELSVRLFDILTLGLEPAITMLYKSETISEFSNFILDKNNGTISTHQRQSIENCVNAYLQKKSYSQEPHKADQSPQVLTQTLTQDQLSFWEENGYLVIPRVVSQEECQQLKNEIYDHIGIDPHTPETWYHPQSELQKIMVPLFNSPTQSVIRSNQKIHDIFKQLWQNNHLIVSTDRASFNPPETDKWSFPGPYLHLDVALQSPIPFGTQGMVYLTDTSEKQGAFCCIPKFHHQFDRWLQTMPADHSPQHQDWSQFEMKPITAKAGDLIIWHHGLPHGSSPNTETQPRIVQYINMQPAT